MEEISPQLESASGDTARADASLPGGFGTFFLAIAALALLRIALGFISLPDSALPAVNILLAILFVAAPVFAEFFGANAPWKASRAAMFLVGGVACHVLFGYLTLKSGGVAAGVCNAIAQMGLATWCVGLGALLGVGLRDKNLLIPISIFGAAYDFYLVIAPAGLPGAGLTKHIIQTAPKVFTSVAAQVPAVSSHAATGRAEVGTYIGPADLVFLAAFFIVVFRFKMNARLTLMLMAPVLVLYMLVVLTTGIALPALVPIGACILVANWKYFNLKRDEWIATIGVAVFCAAFLTWGMLRKRAEPAEPSPPASAPVRQGSATTPAPTSSSPHQSRFRTSPGSTPDRP